MSPKEFVKINVYCPKDAADKVRLAMGKAGAGKIGNYEYCAFVSTGHGYFKPMKGANPAIGRVGQIAQVEEVKIEVLCEKGKIKDVVEAIKKAHPYEEPAIDIVPLLGLD